MKQKKIDINNIQTRLEDVKRDYNFNQTIMKRLQSDIENDEELIVQNGNKTESPSPSYRMYMELQKTNISLRKQINDMEILLQNGSIKTEEEANPFE